MDSRHVFNASLVVDSKVVISAVGVDNDGSRLFLGREDGMLEEFSIDAGSADGVTASLTARKPLALRQPIIALLPATPSHCLVALLGDGSVRFVHSDTLESKVMSRGPVLAAAVSLPPDQNPGLLLPRVAIAMKSGSISRMTRIVVYDIVPSGGQVPGWRQLWQVDLPPFTGVPLVLAWCGFNALVCGAGESYAFAWQRQDTGSGTWRELFSIGTDALPAAVSLPRLSCAFVVAGAVGLIVNSAGEPYGNSIPLEDIPPVRALAAAEGYIAVVCEDGMHIFDASSGHEVQCLEYGEGSIPVPGQPMRAAGGGNGASSIVAVAGRHKVWALSPVPPSIQALELLEKREYCLAIELMKAGARRGEAWALDGYAETALLLLHDGQIADAVGALEQCPPEVFQPSELFPLFPEHVSLWKPFRRIPHWGLHADLQPLHTLLSDDAALGRAACQSVVHYLFRARGLPGTETLDGVDTLLLHLLLDIEAFDQANAFAGVPNAVSVDAIAPRLQSLGLQHALATLWAAKGMAESALALWKNMLTAHPASRGQDGSEESTEALEGATALLKSPNSCPSELVLSHLPWLLEVSSDAAHEVLSTREDLSPDDILPFLARSEDARWRYLEALVSSGRSSDPRLHTELALTLINAICRAEPDLQDPTLRSPPSPSFRGRPVAPDAFKSSGLTVAALVSERVDPDPEHHASTDANNNNNNDNNTSPVVEALRLRLRRHLQTSTLWDQPQVRTALEGTALYEECAVAAAKAEDHHAVLRWLAISLRDVDGAVAYAYAHLQSTDHRILLKMLLDPESASDSTTSPQWEAAAYVVATLGGSLDPLEIVAAVPGSMPLAAALPLVEPLVRERVHRRRQGQITTALERSRLASRTAGKVEAEARRVVVDEGRACLDCHLRIGGKVFVAPPLVVPLADEVVAMMPPSAESGARVVCLNCWNKRGAQVPSSSSSD